ncbi:hypothetical protein ACKTEK_05390 [Tepidamorphus sp. 3E244]|uniref:hypothetical protein n=1 Tax=Tepidamorphus sp. 3E244 TaxID=3385498 RepID=UPI0038FC61D9
MQKSLKSAFGAAVLAAGMAVVGAPAHAEFGSDARQTAFGPFVRVNAGIVAPAKCARITGKRNGAPGGVAVSRNAKPVTVIVAMAGGRCGKRNLNYSFQTTQNGKDFIQIFFVSTSGKLLKKEKVPVEFY